MGWGWAGSVRWVGLVMGSGRLGGLGRFRSCFVRAWGVRVPGTGDDPAVMTGLRERTAKGEGDAPEGFPGLAGLWRLGARVRRRMVRQAIAEGVVRVAAWMLTLVVVGCVADWLMDWPVWWRRFAWLGYLGFFVWAVRLWVVGPWGSVPSGDRLALELERRDPALRSRLISAVQLGRAAGGEVGETRAFVGRLVREVNGTVAERSLADMVPGDRLRGMARRLGLLVLGVGLLWAWGGGTRDALVRRWLGADVDLPRRTRIVEVTGPKVVGRGDDLEVSATVAGVIPKAGTLWVRHGSGREQRLVMEAAGEGGVAGRFTRLLPNLTGDFRYWVRLNDAESEVFEVTVLPRPVVTNLVLTVEYPAYTRLPPRRVAPGELTLLRGGRLRVEARASQALERVEVQLEGLSTQVVARLEAGRPEEFRVDLPVDDPRWTGFAVRLVDTKGIGSLDPAVYAVNVVEDQAPTVRVILPSRREELVTTRGRVLVSFEAKDDFGLAGLRLVHQPAAGTNGAPVSSVVELDLGEEDVAVARRRFEWRLDEIRPPVEEGSYLEFWVEALDRREVGGPGVGRSERYLARVVSEAEKRSDLLTRAGDAIGRLGDVAQGQERLNESLGRIILEKAGPR